MLLLEMGHAPAYATSGRAAIAQATKLRPEFVFLDIGLLTWTEARSQNS